MTNREAHEAAYERRTSALATKHDSECDCGICQYCKGDEDKYGNPSRKGEQDTDALTDAEVRGGGDTGEVCKALGCVFKKGHIGGCSI